MNVYLPCSASKDRESLCSSILAYVNLRREQFIECNFTMAVYLNINLETCDTVSSCVNDFAKSCCLHRFDDIFPSQNVSVYVNIALGQESCMEYYTDILL